LLEQLLNYKIGIRTNFVLRRGCYNKSCTQVNGHWHKNWQDN